MFTSRVPLPQRKNAKFKLLTIGKLRIDTEEIKEKVTNRDGLTLTIIIITRISKQLHSYKVTSIAGEPKRG